MAAKTKTKTKIHEAVLDRWVERDLGEAAAAGELDPAYEVDDLLDQVCSLLAVGRFPVLTGESGVGKTSVIQELARRIAAGDAPPVVEGRRILQISLRRRASALKKSDEMRPEMQKLVEALAALDEPVIVFFRDVHLAYNFDLEPHLQGLPFTFDGLVIGEGERRQVDTMLEDTPELEQQYVVVHVEEPELPVARKIISQWAERRGEVDGIRFTEGALDQALHLTHRFLSRTRLPRKALDLLGALGSGANGEKVTAQHVIARFCQSSKVPRLLVDPSVPLDLDATRRLFHARVLGQSEAVEAVVHMISVLKAGLSDIRRPFGVFLFVGPTGVGKTHLAQLLAEFLFGARDRMIRMNMADYQKEADALTLFGNPEHFSRSQRRGLLSVRVGGHPFGVLLLDEFEKAHANVHDRFLQLFDEGCFVNGNSETVSCRSMIIIATSNAGAEVYRSHAVGFTGSTDLQRLDHELDRRLGQQFRFEFLNRFDRVVHFHPLRREHIRTIALRELEQLRERVGLKQRELTLEVDEAVLDWLTAYGYHPLFGARFLRRTIERSVTTALAEAMLNHEGPGDALSLSVRGGRITAQVTSPPPANQPVRHESTAGRIRRLDRPALVEAAKALLAQAKPRLEALEKRRSERTTLLQQMNAEGFWEEADAEQDILERYRDLDVAVQTEERLAATIEPLVDLAERENSSPTDLARAYDRAATALREWDQRLAGAGPRAVWMLVSNADPLRAAPDWLTTITQMELAWCEHLGFAAEVVAVSADDELSRVVIEVEGSGAAALLAVESGIHRLHRSDGADARARVEILPCESNTDGADADVSALPKPVEHLGRTMTHRARIRSSERGLVVELLGTDAQTLACLAADVAEHWREPAVQKPETARLYAGGGTGARDPRTGVVVPRFKDVMRGRLDPFLEAWRDIGDSPHRPSEDSP